MSDPTDLFRKMYQNGNAEEEVPPPPVPSEEELQQNIISALGKDVPLDQVTNEVEKVETPTKSSEEEKTKPKEEAEPVPQSPEEKEKPAPPVISAFEPVPQSHEEEKPKPEPIPTDFIIQGPAKEEEEKEEEEEEEEEKPKKKKKSKKKKSRKRSTIKAKLYGSMRKAPWESYKFITVITLDVCSSVADDEEALAACIENNFNREVLADLDADEIAVVKKYRFLGIEVEDYETVAYPIRNPVFTDFTQFSASDIVDINELRKVVETYEAMVYKLQSKLDICEKERNRLEEKVMELKEKLSEVEKKCGFSQIFPHILGIARDTVKSHAELAKEKVKAEVALKQTEISKEMMQPKVTVTDVGEFVRTLHQTVRDFMSMVRNQPPPPPQNQFAPPPPPQMPQQPYPYYYPYPYYPPPPNQVPQNPPPQYQPPQSQQTQSNEEKKENVKKGEKTEW